MRILIKIVLSFGVFLLGGIFQNILSASGATNLGVIRLLPGAVIIFGIIGVWRYKPSKKDKNNDNKNLDKTI